MEVTKFSEAYSLAHRIWSMFFDNDHDINGNATADVSPLDVFDGYENEIVIRYTKPHRYTVLHYFIELLYCEWNDGFEDHRNDMLDLVVREYEAVLSFYEVEYDKHEVEEDDDRYEELIQLRIEYLRDLLPLDRIAQDTFQILFKDRLFLMRFNLEIQAYFSPNVKRVKLPVWLKEGVFRRDHGRCVMCATDLTGAKVMKEKIHYDHIVPLALGGTNDPTNFQLLCDRCNGVKHLAVSTHDMYPVYWEID